MSNIIRFKKVREKTGLSRSTVYRRIRRGEFPTPIDLGNGQLGWFDEEIDGWVAARPRHVPRAHGKPKSEPAPTAV